MKNAHVAATAQSGRQNMLNLAGTHTPTCWPTNTQLFANANQKVSQSRLHTNTSYPLVQGSDAMP
jgi:hypothetical protein